MKTTTLIGILTTFIILGGLLIAFSANKEQQQLLSITNFDECALAGYPIRESYPEQCAIPDGRTFINERQKVAPPGDEITANGCAVAGCSGQLCVSAEEAEGVVTTCEFRAEYACYKETSCEPQADGKCGWTQTPELKRCLSNPPSLDMNATPVY